MKQQQLARQLQHKEKHPDVARGTSAGTGASTASVASEDAKAKWMITIPQKDGKRAGLQRGHIHRRRRARSSIRACHQQNHPSDYIEIKRYFGAFIFGKQQYLRAERAMQGKEEGGEEAEDRLLHEAAAGTRTVGRADSLIGFLPRPRRTYNAILMFLHGLGVLPRSSFSLSVTKTSY